MLSHLRLRADHRSERDFAIFDATLYDESGAALVEIEELMLKRLVGGVSLARPGADRHAGTRAEAAASPLLAQLADAIRPAEGMAVLDRLLAAPARAQIVVSPLPLRALDREADGRAGAGRRDRAPRPELLAGAARPSWPRPRPCWRSTRRWRRPP